MNNAHGDKPKAGFRVSLVEEQGVNSTRACIKNVTDEIQEEQSEANINKFEEFTLIELL